MSGKNDKLNTALDQVKNIYDDTNLQLRTNKILGLTHKVYPWNNHDFDYSEIVKQEYNPAKLGINDDGCIFQVFKNVKNLQQYPDLILTKPLLTDLTSPGVSDVDPSRANLKVIKDKYNSIGPPYKNFYKDYPDYKSKLKGLKSSSYFLQSGWCPVQKYKTVDSCQNNDNYKWFSKSKLPKNIEKYLPITDSNPNDGSCYKPRYAFIDNSPPTDTDIYKGDLVSIAKELVELNPLSLVSILTSGNSPLGSYQELDCIEEFTDKITDNNTSYGYVFLVIILILIVILIVIN